MSDAWPGSPIAIDDISTQSPGNEPAQEYGADGFPGQPVSAGGGQPMDVYTTPVGTTDIPAGQAGDPYGEQAASEPSWLDQAKEGIGMGLRADLRGIANVADLVSLPLNVLWKVLGLELPSYRELADQGADAVGLAAPQTDAQKLIGAGTEGLIGGAATAGIGGALSGLGGVTGATGRAVAATPGVDMISGATGGASGELARQNGAGPVGQIIASLAGGMAGAGSALGAQAATRRVTQSSQPSELLAAFNRQQVTPMADQVGGTGARMASGVTRMTLGGIPLAEAAEKSIASARAARDRLANSMGRVTDDTGAGQAAQKGARAFVDDNRKVGALYDSIPIDGKVSSSLSNTRNALAQMTEGMESNPELSRLVAENPRLKGFLDALTPKDVLVDQTLPGGGKAQPFLAQKGGELSWEDLKRFRSIIGEIAGQPSLADDGNQVASMRRLYAALSEDMRATASAQGPEALRKFERANTFFRARQARVDDTLSAILGNDFKKSPEDAFKQIERWSREGGDSARIGRLMRSLPEDEASTVRATIFSRMGNAARKDADGEVYSPTDFVKHWGALDHRAKAVLFPGAEYRQDLDDIARIADAMKRSSEFANTSKTALAGNGIGLVTMALAGSPISAGGIAASQFGVGKLLASPRFARWLASAPRKPNGPATLAHINRLGAIATAEPTIANEVLRLQERLAGAFTPQSLAAEEPGQ